MKRGQSVLEYVIILAAVIVAIIAGANVMKGKVTQSFDDSASMVTDATSNLKSKIGH